MVSPAGSGTAGVGKAPDGTGGGGGIGTDAVCVPRAAAAGWAARSGSSSQGVGSDTGQKSEPKNSTVACRSGIGFASGQDLARGRRLGGLGLIRRWRALSGGSRVSRALGSVHSAGRCGPGHLPRPCPAIKHCDRVSRQAGHRATPSRAARGRTTCFTIKTKNLAISLRVYQDDAALRKPPPSPHSSTVWRSGRGSIGQRIRSARKSLTLVCVGPVISRSPNASKNA